MFEIYSRGKFYSLYVFWGLLNDSATNLHGEPLCFSSLLHSSQRLSQEVHCKEISICVFREKELRGLRFQFSHSCVFELSIYSHDRSTYFP
jgi:hypothetical protein